MKRNPYSKLKLGFHQLFSVLSRRERHQNPDVVIKSNDILTLFANSEKKCRDELSAFVPMPFEVFHPALGGILHG